MNLKGKSFLKLLDFTPDEIADLLALSAELKAKKKAGIPHDTLRGKNIALIFEKASTRTRCAFEVAAFDLGMHATYLDPSGSQIGKKESISDTAQVLGRMYDGIEYRGYGQSVVEELAKYAGVPVWNGLTTEFHPTQILADLLTIQEKFGKLKGIKMAYCGDARFNMGNSLMVGSAKMGLDFVACAPKAYWPSEELTSTCKELAKLSGGSVTQTEDILEGVKDADVIFRRLGFDGRTHGDLGAAHQGAISLSGERKGHGGGETHRDLHALPARVPRPEHHHRQGDGCKV